MVALSGFPIFELKISRTLLRLWEISDIAFSFSFFLGTLERRGTWYCPLHYIQVTHHRRRKTLKTFFKNVSYNFRPTLQTFTEDVYDVLPVCNVMGSTTFPVFLAYLRFQSPSPSSFFFNFYFFSVTEIFNSLPVKGLLTTSVKKYIRGVALACISVLFSWKCFFITISTSK